MAELYSIDTGSIALTAGTAKTCLEISTSTTVTGRFKKLRISSDTTSAGSIKVELISGTTGTGTAYTPKKVNGEGQNRAANVTAKINDTVEPTAVTVLETWILPTPLGGYLEQHMLGLERYVPVSSMYGVRLTSTTVSPNVAVYLEVEE